VKGIVEGTRAARIHPNLSMRVYGYCTSKAC